jgi:hypothetical protein
MENIEPNLSNAAIIVLDFDKSDIEKFAVMDILGTVATLFEEPKSYYNKVTFSISGYDNDAREIFEIPEIRKFMQFIDNCFPYWFYWLINDAIGMHSPIFLLLACVCPLELAKEGEKNRFIEFNELELNRIVDKHVYYMKEIAKTAGMNNDDISLAIQSAINAINSAFE